MVKISEVEACVFLHANCCVLRNMENTERYKESYKCNHFWIIILLIKVRISSYWFKRVYIIEIIQNKPYFMFNLTNSQKSILTCFYCIKTCKSNR